MFDADFSFTKIKVMENQAPEVTDLEELWNAVLSDIELRVSKPNYLTWLKNSRLLENREGSALVALPNSFAKEWVETKYHKLILGSMRSINGNTKHVEYVVEGSLSQRAINRRRREAREYREEKQLVFQEMRVDPETNSNGEIHKCKPNYQRGHIYLKRHLDFDRKNRYELVVLARDYERRLFFSEALVIVDVSDVNDEAPKILLSYSYKTWKQRLMRLIKRLTI